MIKELSIDNWILAGTGFLIIFAVGCFFWYQNVMAQLQPYNDDQSLDSQQMHKSTETPKIEVIDTIHQNTTDQHSSNFDVTSDVGNSQQNRTQTIHRQQLTRGPLQMRILL